MIELSLFTLALRLELSPWTQDCSWQFWRERSSFLFFGVHLVGLVSMALTLGISTTTIDYSNNMLAALASPSVDSTFVGFNARSLTLAATEGSRITSFSVTRI